jgi:hypothetical protein
MAITLAIFNDNGEIYCLADTSQEVIRVVQSCTSKKPMKIRFVKGTEKQMAYIAKALDTIGGGEHEQ